jgi:ribosomal peptide maturation radical SAM protein 1
MDESPLSAAALTVPAALTVHGGQPVPEQSRPLSVALVTMPWVRTDAPSIQCGLLQAQARRHGHRADVQYLNLELAAVIGPGLYDVVCAGRGQRQNFLGEWLFGAAAFDNPPEPEEYFGNYPDLVEALAQRGLGPADMSRLRDRTLPDWVAGHAERICGAGYDVVGFSCTFEQNVASFALARQLKRLRPDLVTVFGGANFDDEMGPEYLRVLSCIDYAVIGEGDVVFPLLLARLAAGRSPVGLPGVRGRSGDAVTGHGTGPMVADLNALPLPDFDEYFATLRRLGQRKVLGGLLPKLLYESSRGCWWGEKHHCTFCGLNRLTMRYRSRAPDRVLADLTALAGRYRVAAIDTVDNIIDMGYFGSLCQQLSEAPWDPNLFYELKANMTRAQIRLLRQAGILRIQPGLESLSSHVLALMRKGTTMLINTHVLKWASYYGITVLWGIITGFPGETDRDYEEQIELIPSLYHLPPPQACGPVWLERFSPFFTEDFPVREVRPREAYRFIYPVPGIDLAKTAYFFDYTADGLASPQVYERLGEAVAQWQARWDPAAATPRPSLGYARGPGWITISDTRGEVPQRITIGGWRAAAYLYCEDKAHSAARVAAGLAAQGLSGVGPDDVAPFLRTCVSRRLMVTEQGRYLSLALPADGYRPDRD